MSPAGVEKRTLLSNIIRYSEKAPTVFIGDKQLDQEKENKAERTLASFCPAVAITSDPDGAKLIPIAEVFKIEQTLTLEKQKAYEQGRSDGQAQGLKEGLKKAEQVLKELNGAIEDTLSQRQAILEEARHKVLDLILQISRKVTFDAISVDPEKTIELIDGVINSLVDRSHLKIKVNPDHLPIVEQNIDRFLIGSATIKELTIEPDPRVKYGGCFIETPSGDIDARLDSQLKVVEDILFTEEDDH